jgi:hypothetical protein
MTKTPEPAKKNEQQARLLLSKKSPPDIKKEERPGDYGRRVGFPIRFP